MAEDLKDDRWRDEGYRLLHLEHIRDVLERWTMTHTRDELFERAQLMRFPWAPIHSVKETLESPQLQARRFFVDTNDSSGEQSPQYPGTPYRFNNSGTRRPKRAPLIGEGNAQIYHGELGLTDEELKRLSRIGVI